MSDRRAHLLITSVILFAAIGISALAAITYFAISYPAEQQSGRSETVNTKQASTADRTAAQTIANKDEGTIATAQPTDKGAGTATNSDLLAHYSSTIEPLLEHIHEEMNGVVLDLKQFLKTVNRTSNPHDTRRVIDAFRDQLKARKERLSNLSDSFKSVTPPSDLQSQHGKLNAGVVKYVGAVQNYINGLSAYSFNQIRSSQNDLEAADSEIKAAADEFQQAITHLTIKTQ